MVVIGTLGVMRYWVDEWVLVIFSIERGAGGIVDMLG